MKYCFTLAMFLLSSQVVFSVEERLTNIAADYIVTVELVAVISEDGLSRLRDIDLNSEELISKFDMENDAIRLRKVLLLCNKTCKYRDLEHVVYASENKQGRCELVRSKWKEGIFVDITYDSSVSTNDICIVGEISIAQPLERKPYSRFPLLEAGMPKGDVGGAVVYTNPMYFRVGERSIISSYKFGNKYSDIGGVRQVVIVTLLIEPLSSWNGVTSDISNQKDIVTKQQIQQREIAKAKAIERFRNKSR